MARTTEAEVLDIEETVRPQAVENHGSCDTAGSEKPESGGKAPSRRFARWILLLVSAVALAGASIWWLHSQDYESTDDAQIEGHLDLVSARISGTVTSINPRVEN